MAELFGYIIHARKKNNSDWAECTIERFLAGDAVSDTEFFYASRILEMNPKNAALEAIWNISRQSS